MYYVFDRAVWLVLRLERYGRPSLAFSWASCFLLVARSDHTTGNRNIKLEVVFKVQKMAQYASFCLIMGPFKGEVPVFARLWPVRVTVSFITGAEWSANLATAGLLVTIEFWRTCYSYYL